VWRNAKDNGENESKPRAPLSATHAKIPQRGAKFVKRTYDGVAHQDGIVKPVKESRLLARFAIQIGQQGRCGNNAQKLPKVRFDLPPAAVSMDRLAFPPASRIKQGLP